MSLYTRLDTKLTKSLITRSKALTTCGDLDHISPMTLKDDCGKSHHSASSLTLRWHYENTPQTFEEVFYVVDSLGTVDVLFRCDVSHPMSSTPAYPIMQRPEQPKEREERLRKEKEVTIRRQEEVIEQKARAMNSFSAARKQIRGN